MTLSAFLIAPRVRRAVLFLVAVALTLPLAGRFAETVVAGPKVLPIGKRPADRRLKGLKDLNGYFPFTPSQTSAEWEQRSRQLRRRLLVSMGLWPMPTRTPANAVIHGKIGRGDYTVEKVYFESFPGFYVTGNLYRPKGAGGNRPGVLCPHGHWTDGRFLDAGRDAVRQQIVDGAERFEQGGRSPLQSRCVQLARMGCVVFHYDMIGYADSVQISYELAHRFRTQRPEMNTTEDWGLFSPQAETHLQSIMGMQAYNSIRALDFLSGLSDVDSERLAVTGASGGGTQTFILSAIDPRPAVAFPAVMVSTAMQGGCTCENASLLRVGTGNVEIAALFAPRPLGMTAANDWTHEMTGKGFPDLRRHYEMMGAADNVMLKSLVHFGHNYNYVSRAAMYSWLNRHLKLGVEEPVVEEDYQRLTKKDLSVWDADHPAPAGGPDFERDLLRAMSEDSEAQMAELVPHDKASLARYREVAGGAVDVLIGRGLPNPADVKYEQIDETDRGGYLELVGLLKNGPQGEELPIVFLHPKQWGGRVVVWIDGRGKSGMFYDDGSPRAEIYALVDAGVSVVGVDLLYQGEFQRLGTPVTRSGHVDHPSDREFAGYTFGYNHTLFARRVHDILSVLSFVKNYETAPKAVDLVGHSGAGPWVAAARAQAREAVDRVVVDTGGFRFGKLLDIYDVNFLPGGAKYGDLPGMLALSAPGKMWLAGEGHHAPRVVEAAYEAAGHKNDLTLFDGDAEQRVAASVKWLLAEGR